MYHLAFNIQSSAAAANLLTAAGIRLAISHFLLAASPYLVVGVIVLITLAIFWRQIRQLKTGGGSCCSRSDGSSAKSKSKTAHTGDLPGCSGCSYAGRCQPGQPPAGQKGTIK